MDAIIVTEFSDGYPVGPVILSVVDKDLEVGFNLLVDLFGLAICLRVISGRGHGFDA